MRLILILRQLSKEEEAAIQATDVACYVAEGIKTELSATPIKNDDKAILAESIAFGQQHINGQLITDWLSYRKHSFWFYTRFLTHFRYLPQRRIQRVIEQLLAQHPEVKSLEVYANSKLARELLPKGVAITFHAKAKKKGKPSFGYLLRYALVFALRALTGLFQLPLLFKKTDHLLLIREVANDPLVDLKTGQTTLGDKNMGFLVQKTLKEKDFFYLSEYQAPKLGRSKKLPLKKRSIFPHYPGKTINFEFFQWLAILSPIVWSRAFRFNRQMSKLFASDVSHLSAHEKLLFRSLRSYKRMTLYTFLRAEAAGIMFSLLKCKTVSTINENGVQNGSILKTARLKGIPTVGIQHGNIHPLHPSYIYSKADMAYGPVPDKTILWGESWKQVLLQESSYRPDSLPILGQMRTDSIQALSKLKKADIHPDFVDERPLIMYSSQGLFEGDNHIRQQLVTDVLRLAKENPTYQVVIKPHPNEYDWDFFHNIAMELGVTNYRVMQEDLYKMLSVCDISLIYYSTVGVETVYFRKPMIVLDYLKADSNGYIRDEVAFQALNFEELNQHCRAILSGEQQLSPEKQTAFIHERAYKIDGQVTQRHIDYLRSLVKH